MKNKIFAKQRICAIDACPCFKNSLKQAKEFTAKHNISINTADGKKIILSFFLKEIASTYKETISLFPKVLFFSNDNIHYKFKPFINKYVIKLLERSPLPFCGIYCFNSPELEMAAARCLEQKAKTNKIFEKTIKRFKFKNANEIVSNKF